MGDVGGESLFAREGGVQPRQQAVELLDNRLEFQGHVAEAEAIGKIAFPQLVDVAGDALDRPHRSTDDPNQNNPRYDDGQRAQSDQEPTEALQGAMKADGFGGDAEDDGAGIFRPRDISFGVGLDGGDEGHADGAAGAAIGEKQVSEGDLPALGWARKVVLPE